MNTLEITRIDETKVRVTIRSEGERDQHVDVELGYLQHALENLPAGQVAYRDPTPPAVGEPPTVVPSSDDALITSSTVPPQPPAETVEPPTQQPDA